VRNVGYKLKFLFLYVIVILIATGIFVISTRAVSSMKSPSIKKIAILPFKVIKYNSKTDYISFGLTHEIITKISYIEQIVVRPSSAVTKYKNEMFSFAVLAPIRCHLYR